MINVELWMVQCAKRLMNNESVTQETMALTIKQDLKNKFSEEEILDIVMQDPSTRRSERVLMWVQRRAGTLTADKAYNIVTVRSYNSIMGHISYFLQKGI